jgi:Na+/glutamate symporter
VATILTKETNQISHSLNNKARKPELLTLLHLFLHVLLCTVCVCLSECISKWVSDYLNLTLEFVSNFRMNYDIDKQQSILRDSLI